MLDAAKSQISSIRAVRYRTCRCSETCSWRSSFVARSIQCSRALCKPHPQLNRVLSSNAEHCEKIEDVTNVNYGKQALTDGKTSACLTEDAAKELTLDSFSSMAVLLHQDVPDMTSATLHKGLVLQQV